MFNAKGNTSSRTAAADGGSVNIIGSGTSIDGDIVSGGDIRIDGNLKGSVNTRGKLVVGPTGVIEGEVHCQNADISGTVKGNVNVAELLTLKATSKLSGDLVTGKLAIEPGADFSGSCTMAGVTRPALHDSTATTEPQTA
ncbi:MAG: polymer-forming cytoskeletal protein [Bacteroidetes bacterium]|nr:polymer-forming cytoskeletal protein [Bacteroidota bacterium]